VTTDPPRIGLAKLKPSKPIVEILRDVLERAERGEVRGLAIAAHLRGGETLQGWSLGTDGSVGNLVYGLELVKCKLMRIGEES